MATEKTDHRWSMSLGFDSIAVEFLWSKGSNPHRDPFYEVSLLDSDTGKDASLTIDEKLLSHLRTTACYFRAEQLRAEFLYLDAEGTDALKAAIVELLERSESGEFLGQTFDNRGLSIRLISEIFEVRLKPLYRLLRELVAEDKLSLGGNGHIYPFVTVEERFKELEEITGHRRLHENSPASGKWFCEACGRAGSDCDWAEDYSCPPNDKSLKEGAAP